MRPIGVEIEIVGFKNPSKEALVNLYNTCVKWNAPIGTDGSLHSDSAVEIRTSPAAGKAFVHQVREITRAIRAAGGFVDENCGLHVHVDMRDYIPARCSTSPQLNCLTEMWALCEKEFYKIVSPERETGTYSKPWYSAARGWYYSAYGEEILKTALYGSMAYHYLQEIGRYSGCNLHALSKHKTIEYRLHQGTVNTRIITAWALLCAAFTVQATESKAPTELWKFVRDIGPLAYLEWLAPTPDAKRYVTWARNKQPQRATVDMAESMADIEDGALELNDSLPHRVARLERARRARRARRIAA